MFSDVRVIFCRWLILLCFWEDDTAQKRHKNHNVINLHCALSVIDQTGLN